MAGLTEEERKDLEEELNDLFKDIKVSTNDVLKQKEILLRIYQHCFHDKEINWGDAASGEVPDNMAVKIYELKTLIHGFGDAAAAASFMTEYINDDEGYGDAEEGEEEEEDEGEEDMNISENSQKGGMRRHKYSMGAKRTLRRKSRRTRSRYSRKAKRVTRRRHKHSRKAKKVMRRKSRKARMS